MNRFYYILSKTNKPILFFWLLSSFQCRAAISYSFTASSGAFTANSTPTTIHSTSVDDALSAAINIGFTFNFGGCTTTSYTQIKVSSNGWLSLGTGATGSQAANDMAWSSYGPLLAPLWDDLKTGTAGNVNYKLTGSAPNRIFTVEWLNMRWDWAASNPSISFQVKLYETSNKIEYIYRQEASAPSGTNSCSIGINGGVAGDYYSLNGSGASPSAIYGTATNNINSRPATGQIYSFTLPSVMTYTSSSTTQANTSDVYQSSTNQEIISIPIVISGGCTPFSLTQIQINMNGSTSTSDVTNIDIYYTGTSSTYSVSTLFGSVAPGAGTLSVNGSQVLQNGTNYFWVVYDISATAVVGNFLDAQCTQITMNGGIGNKIPTTTNPAGNRPIVTTPSSFAKWINFGWGRCVKEISSTGGIIWAGQTNNTYSTGGNDGYFVKTDYDLNIIWTRVIGTGGDERINDIIETSDGFIGVGYTTIGSAGGYDILVVKINNTGVIQWTKTIGYAGNDEGNGIIKTSDGNVAICGNSAGNTDGYFAKINNATGAIIAERRINTSNILTLNSIIETLDGGFLMGGTNRVAGDQQFQLIKLTSAYSLDWERQWGGGSGDYINFVLENSANDYTVGGFSYSYGAGGSDGYLLRFTWSGSPTVTWVNAYGTSDNNTFKDGVLGSYVMTGITTKSGDPSNDELFIAKINTNGSINYMKSIGTVTVGEDQEGYGITSIASGGYAATGLHTDSQTNFFMTKISSDAFNCASIQDNGGITSLSAPALNTDGLTVVSTSLPTNTNPSPSVNTGGVIEMNGCITVLPIELVFFSGTNKERNNFLYWSTTTETNNDYFTIERSADGVHWEYIGSVDGANTSYSIHNYSFIDYSPYLPITYYRLKQTDFDGQTKLSNIISIKCCNENSNYFIYPNPITDAINISINQISNEEITVEIIRVC